MLRKLTFSILMFSIPGLFGMDTGFLEQAENIERESWWVLTGQRETFSGSPFRVVRGAFLMSEPNSKVKIQFSFCKKLKTQKLTKSDVWLIESECQKPKVELARLEKQSENRWKLSWQTASFSDHFGLGVSILYPQLFCEFQVDSKGILREFTCPLYAKNRNADEIIELSRFVYTHKDSTLLKLKGVIKKNLEVIGTLESEVPLSGEIVVKEKKLPQVEEKNEVNDEKKQPSR